MEFLALLFILSLLAPSNAEISNKMGINYGMLGDNLLNPSQSIQLIQSMKAGRVKLYDANPEVLRLLSGSKLHVSIMVQNHDISGIASSQTLADEWVADNILPYYPNTMIRFVLIGNEVLSYYSDEDRQLWHELVPAMRRIRNSLKAKNIRNIKVGTPLAMDVVESPFPPSGGKFRLDISDSVMVPLLRFLNGTRSYFFLDVYTYFPWSANLADMNLDFALLHGDFRYTDPGNGLVYANMLDQMLDSVISAMTRLGYPAIPLIISETGWPNAGDIDQPGANIHNAATYNRNLIHKITARPPVGTPARPGITIPAFIFSLYNENLKSGPGTERHWGLVHPNGTEVYSIDLSGKRSVSEYDQQPVPTNNEPYRGELWCVVAQGVNSSQLGLAIEYACAQGNGTCAALAPGRECYNPSSNVWNANYAFSSYWARFRSQGASCYFNGFAEQTTRDPSSGSCKFPSVTL